MRLQELIEELETADPEHVAPLGFGKHYFWRQFGNEVVFRPAKNVSVKKMLECALKIQEELNAKENLNGALYADCYISDKKYPGWDAAGPMLVAYMTGKVK